MKLSKTQTKILAGLQFAADLSIEELARELKLKTSNLHYHIKRFRDLQIIRPGAFIDFFRMGYSQYSIYFSISPEKKQIRNALNKALKSHPRVIWFAELGGQYQYGLTIYVNTANEVTEFMDQLVLKFGNIFLKHDISQVTSFTLLSKRYLCQTLPKSFLKYIRMQLPIEQVPVDVTDLKIIHSFFNPQHNSREQMAQLVGIPRTTLNYRIEKLKELKVLKEQIYYISANKLGRQVFKVLLSQRGVQAGWIEDLRLFCLKTPEIVNLQQCLGRWDYELVLEVAQDMEAVRVCQDLCETFGNKLADIVSLPIFLQTTSDQLFNQS